MNKLFGSVKFKRPKRTPHDLSYATKMSLHFGRLCPMLLEKQIPTDKIYDRDEFLVRFAPFFGQVFQAFPFRTEYFFVPSRLLWRNFELFTARGLDGNSSYVHPYLNLKRLYIWIFSALGAQFNNQLLHTVFDYFNLPTDSDSVSNIVSTKEDVKIDVLPFYAMVKIFLDYYADENLEYLQIIQLFESGEDFAIDGDNTDRIIDLFTVLNGNFAWFAAEDPTKTWFEVFLSYYRQNTSPLALQSAVNPYDANDFLAAFSPFYRSYPKDYFTSALPFAQRGPIVQIPLNGEGDVKVFNSGSGARYQGVGVTGFDPTKPDPVQEVSLFSYGEPYGFIDAGTNPRATYGAKSPQSVSVGASDISAGSEDNSITFKAVNINGTATVIDLRTALTVQAWLEKRARSGSRFTETLAASFGIRSKDYRLQRVQFLTRFASTVKIGEVFTTAQDDSGDFVPGLGVSVGQLADGSRRWKKFIDEPGYTMGFVSVYPSAAYFQGVPRQFLELDVFDYYWPEFQFLGEQDIKNIELMPRQSGNYDSFGYTPRYAQYKCRNSQIHGDFRGSLSYMTSARRFSTPPNLNNNFVQAIPSVNDSYRVFNATGEWADAAPIYVDIYHHLKMVRPMSYFGNPRLI